MRRIVVLVALLGAVACRGGVPRLPAATDDRSLAEVIAHRLVADVRLCPFALSVIVYNRTARLEGKVASPADRERAVRIAVDAGAARVDDRLIIDPSAGDAAGC